LPKFFADLGEADFAVPERAAPIDIASFGDDGLWRMSRCIGHCNDRLTRQKINETPPMTTGLSNKRQGQKCKAKICKGGSV
jgi:hypothetical protein